MPTTYTITAIEGDTISVQYDDGSWAKFRVTADMTPEQVDDVAYQFGPKPVTVAPDFLTVGSERPAQIAPPPPAPEITPPVEINLEDDIRYKRFQLLSLSDWTQLPDSPVDQAAWAAYRQELRDVPQQAGFPENVVWPELVVIS
jgi:hypothetical protein